MTEMHEKKTLKLREGTDAERQQYAARGGRITWRLLMPKTRTHVYYRVDDAAGEAFAEGPRLDLLAMGVGEVDRVGGAVEERIRAVPWWAWLR